MKELLRFAYLAENSIHLVDGTETRSFRSQFAQQYIDRSLRLARRNAWKTQGTGARFMGSVMPGESAEQIAARVPIGSPAAHEHRLFYTVETDEMTVLLSFDPVTGQERRIFHSNEEKVCDLGLSPSGGPVACSVRHKQGMLDLALADLEHGGLRELTEGDSMDSAPS